MRMSKLYAPKLKNRTGDITSDIPTYRLLEELSLVEYSSSGTTTFLPIGQKIIGKIEEKMRDELETEEFQEIGLPLLQRLDLWKESERISTFGNDLMYLGEGLENMIIAPTSEEVIIDLLRRGVSSYKQLPLFIYQIADRFRNISPRRGIIRGKEFRMMESYGVYSDSRSAQACKVHSRVFKKLFNRFGLDYLELVKKENTYHDFIVRSNEGEDYFTSCTEGHIHELDGGISLSCEICKKPLIKEIGLSIAMYMILNGDMPSKMNASFASNDAHRSYFQIVAGGSGVSRILQAIVDQHRNKEGISWPDSVRPFEIGIIPIRSEVRTLERAENLYHQLSSRGVLLDDRDVPVGRKRKTMDQLGVKRKLVLGERENKEKKITVEDINGSFFEIGENNLGGLI